MKLKALLRGLDVEVKGSREIDLTGVTSDSRTLGPGNLFIAKRGQTHDGTQFIPQAIEAGAAAVATDMYDPFLDKPQIIHPDVGSLEAQLAARYYGRPSKELFVVGVTGTKGKTTTSYLIRHFLDGKQAGLIGTVETIVGRNRFSSTHTTHDVATNQKWLREMVANGCQAAVLEVSSHGLAQGRLDEIEFNLAVFTNLYPDHLDYHRTMEEYARAKKRLFERAKNAVLNADSEWASYMGTGLTFGIEQGELRAEEIAMGADGTEFTIRGVKFVSPLIGRFNVYNVLGAVAAALQTGATLEQLRDRLLSFPGVPARLERVGNVFIDFAHTGEALENVLKTLREIGKGRVIAVFGCGGNRDPGRRTGMARAADQWADISIVTSDNPRQEDPNEIARQIIAGFQKPPFVELDRKKAIQWAISLARPEDLVLIAGKGHEKVQIFASHQVPFDDVAVAKEALFCHGV